jgi:hypothetical protein
MRSKLRKRFDSMSSEQRTTDLLDLLHSASDHFADDGVWPKVRLLLETLPLSSTTFGQAANHLQNAQRYVTAGEIGAARFELRMLQRGLITIPGGERTILRRWRGLNDPSHRV